MKDFLPLEKRLKLEFRNKDLLVQAFCHRSYLNENLKFGMCHNERLEFLGDAVLELVVTEELYIKYPDKPEGELTSWRAALVNANILADVARELGFNDFLLLSQGEAKDENKARQYILANTFEAMVGALYIDQGYEPCKDFIKRDLITKKLPTILEKKLFKDAKSLFQEKAQEVVSITPNYSVLEEKGPDHLKQFVVGVYLAKEMIAKGEGTSKQEAEVQAAKNALEKKNWN